MNTMEITKIAAGAFAALLFLLLVKWAADEIYHVGPVGHGDEEHVAGYPIEVDEDEGGVDVAVEVDMVALVAEADAAKGEKVFGKCKACHKLEDGANGVGPHLYALVDRPIGTVDGYAYSGTLAEMGGAWDIEALSGFLTKPKSWAPGTKMGFAGLSKDDDRANLIAYLQTIGG